MRIYTVHLPAADRPEGNDPVHAELVREGFSLGAFFLAVPWLIYNGLWVALVIYVAVMVGLGVAGEMLGGVVPFVAIAVVHIYFASIANNLLRSRLDRRGYRFVGVTGGGTFAEAEIRAFAGGTAHAPPPRRPYADVIGRAVPPRPGVEVVGLFPPPGGRTA